MAIFDEAALRSLIREVVTEMQDEDEILSLSQVSKIFHVAKTTVQRAIESGALAYEVGESTNLGRATYQIKRSDATEWHRQHRRK